jgi:hypothetical protein
LELQLHPLNQGQELWRTLTSRCLVNGPAAGTDLDSALALLGQAIRGDITASIADLRELFEADPRH